VSASTGSFLVSVARGGHQEAGHPALVDVVGEVLVEAVQRLAVQPHLSGIDLLPKLCHRSPPSHPSRCGPIYPARTTSDIIVAQETATSRGWAGNHQWRECRMRPGRLIVV
jgi:hypothetical protein